MYLYIIFFLSPMVAFVLSSQTHHFFFPSWSSDHSDHPLLHNCIVSFARSDNTMSILNFWYRYHACTPALLDALHGIFTSKQSLVDSRLELV